MSEYKSEFLQTLSDRGFIHQVSDAEGLDDRLSAGPISAYIGFDCTAPSLHAGSLVPIMMLYWLQQTGHRPIVLMGGGTTRVGDPSGKDQARQMLTPALIEDNKAGIRTVFERFLSFEDGAAMMMDNAEWLLELNYIDLLREVGAQVSVNEMLKRDSVAMRLEREQHLSFLEFNYMILQAYDFVEIYRRTGCILQMGGSDQWGNILSGTDLGRRLEGAELFGLTSPLLTTASGAKMGKTADGAVWLDAEMKSPYDYWQFWRNTEDADVERFLKLFTVLPMEEIARLAQLQGAELNDAKKVLATEATALIHGREAAAAAGETARKAFEEGAQAAGLPSIDVAHADLEAGLGVLTAFVQAGLAPSTSEVRRHIKGGGARVNDAAVTDPNAVITVADLTDEGAIKLSVGKKKHVLIRPTS